MRSLNRGWCIDTHQPLHVSTAVLSQPAAPGVPGWAVGG